MDRELLAFRLGALEPPDQLRVEERLRTDPVAAASLWVPLALEPDPWRVPPQGLGIASRVVEARVFRGSLRAGDRFTVELTSPDPDRFVVVLLRDEAWQVVFPSDPSVRFPLRSLPHEGDVYTLELSAAAQAGRQDWAIALPRAEQLDGGWEGLQAAMAEGQVPVTRVHIEVDNPRG